MIKRKRIAILSPFLTRPARGIERFSVELATRLSRRPGYRVDLITWMESDDWVWGDLGPDLNLIRLRLPRYYRRFWAGICYAGYLMFRRPAVVQIFFTWHGEGIALKMVPWILGRVMLNLHFPISIAAHRYDQMARSGLAARVGRLVGVSEVVSKGARARFDREVETVLNGVDLNRFGKALNQGRLRESFGIAKDVPVFSCVAALEERKNVGTLIQAFRVVVKERNDAVLLIAGEGDERSSLESMIEKNDLGGRVRLVGNYSRIEEVYHVSDIFVFLGIGEAFGLAPIEAMACGLPVVSARYEPFPDLLCPDGTVFVDGADIDEISAEMLSLCGDEERCKDMGRANRAFAEQEYSWEKTTEGYENVYASIASSENNPVGSKCDER